MQKGELGAVVRVSASTAGEILNKIAMVIVDQMTGDFQEFSSAAFLEVYERRSRATPAFAHPRAEEEVFEIQRESAPIAISEIAKLHRSLGSNKITRFTISLEFS